MTHSDLMSAVYAGDVATCQTLLASDCNTEAKNIHGATALHLACEQGHVQVCQCLLDFGAHIEAVNSAGRKPLHIAALRNNSIICRLLLDRGANIEAVDGEQWTPLHTSAIAKVNAKVNATATMSACQMLLDAGALIEAKSRGDWTPLISACWSANYYACRTLLDHGAKIETRDRDGRSPLYFAAHGHYYEICLLLLAHGASPSGINSRDTLIQEVLGYTQLQAAACLGELPVLQFILHNDLRRDSLPDRVEEAISMAKDEKQMDSVAMLQSWLARQSIDNVMKMQPGKVAKDVS